MKLRISLLLVVALMTGACQKRSRLSPTVLTPPTPEKPARVAQKPQSKPAVAATSTANTTANNTKAPAPSKTSVVTPSASASASGSVKSFPTAGVSGPSYSGSAPLSPYPATVSAAPTSSTASTASSSTSAPSTVASKPAASKTVRSKATGSSKLASAKSVKVDEKVSSETPLEKKKNVASVSRSEAKMLAEASLEAGRQLLRDEQHESALKAFREAVRLNSNSAEAWMGIAFVSERNGNMKTAVEAFKEAKKLWGM